MAQRRYRVAQWATGDVGMRCLRGIIEHPQFDLVGVKVYSEAKVGKDAGELCGTAPTGVTATQDIEQILAARPDCVLYMPDRLEPDMLCRLLEAGANVVTARVEFNYRDCVEPELRGLIEAACERGQSSLYSTGATPGWFTEVMPLALSMLERRIDCITLTDFADMSGRNQPDMIFRVLPFGRDPASIDPGVPGETPMIAPGSLSMTAAALGLAADEFVATREFALAKQRVEFVAGSIDAATIGAMRRTTTGLRDGKPVIRRVSALYVTKDVEPAWDLRDSGQHLRIEGDVPLEVMFTMPVSAEEYVAASPGMTANPAVNAVPYVCAAKPGIVHTDELPFIIGRFG